MLFLNVVLKRAISENGRLPSMIFVFSKCKQIIS